MLLTGANNFIDAIDAIISPQSPASRGAGNGGMRVMSWKTRLLAFGTSAAG